MQSDERLISKAVEISSRREDGFECRATEILFGSKGGRVVFSWPTYYTATHLWPQQIRKQKTAEKYLQDNIVVTTHLIIDKLGSVDYDTAVVSKRCFCQFILRLESYMGDQ
jgi:hypothetical protein